MPNRRLIRSTLADVKERVPAPGKSKRKPVPPENTSAEAYYYVKQINAQTEVVVTLTDGERLTGTIEWYDRGSLKLNRDDAPDLVLMKHAIRSIHKPETEN